MVVPQPHLALDGRASAPPPVPLDSATTRALRRGVATSTQVMGAVSGVFAIAVFLFERMGAGHLRAGFYVHVLTAAFLFTVSRIARRPTVDARGLRMVDAIATMGTGLGIAFFLAGSPSGGRPAQGPELVLLLFGAHALLFRAAVVPSEAERTFRLGATALVPILVVIFVHLAGARGGPHMKPVTFTLLFAFMTLATSTLISRRFFGEPRDPAEMTHLGPYLLERKIAEGGMGEVYRARHAFLRRPAAVKVIRHGRVDMDTLEQFEAEVQLTSALEHPNTVRIYDYGRSVDGEFYYAMEYVDGLTLTELVSRDGPQPAGRVANILAQVCAALAEAHARGIVHRDIKPDNVLIAPGSPGGAGRASGDRVKVVDFGLARLAAAERAHGEERCPMGTPQYMAPEAVLAPESVDARTDLYAVGALGYFLLTGTHVFDGPTDAVLRDQLRCAPLPPSDRLGAPVPADLEAVVLACLAKDPRARPGSAAELRGLLRRHPADRTWPAEAAARFWSEPRVRAARGVSSAGDTAREPMKTQRFPRVR